MERETVQILILKENFWRAPVLDSKESIVHEEVKIGLPEKEVIEDLINSKSEEITTKVLIKVDFREAENREKIVLIYELECYATFNLKEFYEMKIEDINGVLFSKSKVEFYKVYKKNLNRMLKNAGFSEHIPKVWI